MIYGIAIAAQEDDLMADGDTLLAGGVLITIPDETPVALPTDTLVTNPAITLSETEYPVRVAAYLRSVPGSLIQQKIRAVVYTVAGALLIVSDEVTVPAATVTGWVTFEFPTPIALAAGDYLVALHGGPGADGVDYYTAADASDRKVYTAAYADGPPATLPSGTSETGAVVMFLETIRGFVVPAGVSDDYLATLPFDVTQEVFGASAPISNTRVSATAGWYGTTFDPTTGANAIVRSDGPLAGLVGERIIVTRRGAPADRNVYVYVSNELDFPDELAGEDLELTARAFLALGPETLDSIDVDVRVLA